MSNQLLSSKVIINEELPSVRPIIGVSTNICGFAGVCEKGPIGSYKTVTSPDEYKKYYGGYSASGDVAQAIDGFFSNGGNIAYISRVVHCSDATDPTTRTSSKATIMAQTAAASPSAGTVLGSVVGPYALAHGDTVIVNPDGAGNSTATISAVAALRECATAENYALSNAQNITVKVDGGAVQTIAFLTAEFVSIGAATAEEVAAVINAKITGARATVTSTGTKVTITSDRKGTGSHIQVTGGTANGALGFSTSVFDGSGNVANVDAVTVAELKTIIEAAVSGVTVTNVGGAVQIASNTTGGSSTVIVSASSTADDELGLDNATHTGSTGAAVNTLRFDGKYDGTYAASMQAIVETATSAVAAEFNLRVVKSGVTIETFVNLTMDATSVQYVQQVFNNDVNGSDYFAAVDQLVSGSATVKRPANGTYTLTGGGDGLSSLADSDFTGGVSSNGKVGIRVFDLAADMSLLCVPGRATSAVHNAMITYCDVTRDRAVFPILDPPASSTASAMVTYVQTTAAIQELSEFAAIYWPRIKVANPNKTIFGLSDQITVAPSGYIAGVMARNDGAREGGVYDAPAGVEKGIIFGCLGFETDECLDEAKRDLVCTARINPITTQPGFPRYIDGSDTLKSTGNFPSVPERRGVIFIEQSVKRGLQFARHKNNDETLRAEVVRTVTGFLTIQMKNRAFRSQDPATAFYVDFSESLNPPAVQFVGKLIGRVGLATAKPAKFIIVNFSQDTRSLAA